MPWTPNVLTNVGDIKVAQTALQPFLKTLLPVAAFSRNFSPNPADKGDMIRVPIVGAPSESSDFQGDYTANSGADIQTVPVVLNRHKYKTVHVTATEAADTALNVLETLVVSAAQQLAIDVVQDIFTAITAAAYGAPAIQPLAPSDFNYKAVLGVREACAQAKMPVSERSLILDSSYYTNLLADDVVAKSFNLNLSAPGVVEGDVKRLAGFDIYETLAIPLTQDDLCGFAAHPSGLAIAMRYLQPVAQYEEAGAVTDPVTGLTFGYLRFTLPQHGVVFVTLECLYGFATAIPAGIQRICHV
jgi:hypothetical protein